MGEKRIGGRPGSEWHGWKSSLFFSVCVKCVSWTHRFPRFSGYRHLFPFLCLIKNQKTQKEKMRKRTVYIGVFSVMELHAWFGHWLFFSSPFLIHTVYYVIFRCGGEPVVNCESFVLPEIWISEATQQKEAGSEMERSVWKRLSLYDAEMRFDELKRAPLRGLKWQRYLDYTWWLKSPYSKANFDSYTWFFLIWF